MATIRRALISLSDKNGILEFAEGLQALKVEILSTGGTAKLLKDNGIPVVEVGDYTGQPEIMDGRLKTLHPKIHGGLLAVRDNPEHMKQIKQSGIEPIDLVVVNLYPFEQTIAKSGVSLEEAIEQIDIGGPTMLRAAAKNWQDVTVIVDPADYGPVLEELKKNGAVSKETNFRLAQKVFITTSRYDGAITNYLTGGREGKFPEVFNYQTVKAQGLRYGENPHQKAVFYREHTVPASSIPNARQLHGKELSFNNILDLDAALEVTKSFSEPAVVIIKHTNPCGVAVGASPLKDIFIAARDADAQSAFGGIIGINRCVDAETAAEIGKDFYECVVAPEFDPEALEILKSKKNIRLMELTALSQSALLNAVEYDLKKVSGGLLVQEKDRILEKVREAKVATKRAPTEAEWTGLEFSWIVCRHVKSNAIVYASLNEKIFRTVGVGCGQTSRVDAARFGALKAKYPLKGSVMASDAFFPFRDNVDEAAKAGITAIIQPGGSIRDRDVIEAADEHGIAMVFTGVRHFRH